jgi:hypothetical protein
MNEDALSVSYTVSVADLEAFADHELRTTLRRRLLLQGLFTSLMITTLAYFFLYSQFHHHVAALSVAIPFGLLLAYALPGVTRDQQLKGIRKLYRGAADPALGPHSITFQPEGLATRSDSGSGLILWSAFQRVALTSNHAFLVLGPLKALVIPLQQIPEPSRSNVLAELSVRVPSKGTRAV